MGHPKSVEHSLPSHDRSAATELEAAQDEVLNRWLVRVRQELPHAREQSHPILIDTLPVFLTHVAQALDPNDPRGTAVEGSTVPEEHGGERARLTNYRPDDLVAEYQILRSVVLEYLESRGVLRERERNIIVTSFDQAVRASCTAFFLVSHNVREQFTVTLTHDLRTPLTAAMASAELILRHNAGPEISRWAVRVIDNLERADRMIRDLLDASRLGAGERLPFSLEQCDLVTLVKQVIEQLATLHGDRFVLCAPESVKGWWSGDALRRAVENLATNAVKYGSSDQPITITVKAVNGRVIVLVHNHGSYVPIQEQETLFQPFRRHANAQRSGKVGWGVGLPLARGVVESHGGSISIESMPATGTTFALDLPCDARPFQNVPITE